MSDGVGISFPNLDAFLADVRALPDVVQKRVMLGAVATAASVIRKDAIARAPEFTGTVAEGHPPPGTLKKAIYQVRIPSECTSTLEVWKIGVRRGKRAQRVGKKGLNMDAYYALWVEVGHFTRVPMAMTKTAKAAGRALGVARWVPAHPFMRPAIETKRAAAIEAMRDYLNRTLPLAAASTRFFKAA